MIDTEHGPITDGGGDEYAAGRSGGSGYAFFAGDLE